MTPDGIQITKLPDGRLQVVRKWYGLAPVLVAAVAIVIIGVLYLVWIVQLSPEASLTYRICCHAVPLAIITILAYFLVVSWFNRTTLIISGKEITIRHRPLWWPGRKRFNAMHIKQLYCSVDGDVSKPPYVYKIMAIAEDGRHVRFLSFIFDLRQAHFIEKLIEKHLWVEDRRVKGELVEEGREDQ
jgi:hypothetical protein